MNPFRMEKKEERDKLYNKLDEFGTVLDFEGFEEIMLQHDKDPTSV